jgi:hypothetical protein
VSKNYQRLVSQAVENIFEKEPENATVGEFRRATIGRLRNSFNRVFPELLLNDLGNPLIEGTFRFDKGESRRFEYQHLSSGEKSVFDLLLDLFIHSHETPGIVFCIDEPETHLNSKMQAALLEEMLALLPDNSQLWLATHSVGIIRRARQLYADAAESVTFLDFADRDFDVAQRVTPILPSRAFWRRALTAALDDLAGLIAPSRLVLCEGSPLGGTSKHTAHDAHCYEKIFASQYPDVTFLSVGNSSEVENDRLSLGKGITALIEGISVDRLIDRDDHSEDDVLAFRKRGIRVLSRRNIESFLFHDDVLRALCVREGKPEMAATLVGYKADALVQTSIQGKPFDDVKAAAGLIYVETKRLLGLTQIGNDQMSFARNVLAELIQPGLAVYEELRACIFD